MRPKCIAVAVTAALAGAFVVGLAPQASAHSAVSSYKYSGKGWTAPPNFLFNHPLCVGGACTKPTSNSPNPVGKGNVVVLWQRILYVDGFGPHTSVCEVDGEYGAETKSNTLEWQRRRALFYIDGRVGYETWNRAEVGGQGEPGITQSSWDSQNSNSTIKYYRYRGTGAHGSVGLRHFTSNYLVMQQHHAGYIHDTNHPGITLTGCGCGSCGGGGGGGGGGC